MHDARATLGGNLSVGAVCPKITCELVLITDIELFINMRQLAAHPVN